MAGRTLLGIQAARDDDLLGRDAVARDQSHVLPVPPVMLVGGRVDQHAPRRPSAIEASECDSSDGIARQTRTPRASDVPCKLGDVEPGVKHDPGDGLRRLVHEHSHLPHVGWNLLGDHRRARWVKYIAGFRDRN